jgi:hypothetical protein
MLWRSWEATQVATSQEQLSSMELVTCSYYSYHIRSEVQSKHSEWNLPVSVSSMLGMIPVLPQLWLHYVKYWASLWATLLQVCDSLLNIGPCGNISMGEPAFLSEEFSNMQDPDIELFTTSGYGKNGALCVLQRSVRPQVWMHIPGLCNYQSW